MSTPLVRWTGLGALGCLLVLVAAWLLLVAPTRATAADLRAQAEAQETVSAGLRAQLTTLRQQAAELPAQEAALERIARKVPGDAALPELVRALDALAARTGVQLSGLNPSVPAAAAADAVTAVATTPAVGTSDTTPAPAAPAAPPYTTVPLALEVSGSWFDVQAFVVGLEDLERAVRVTGVQLASGAADGAATAPTGALRASLTAEAYVATEEGS